MRKMIVAGALAIVTMGAGGTAFAGEVNGKGEETPIKSRHVASSECAFSGLEDGSEDPEAPSGPGATQSWGQIPKQVRDEIAQFGAHPGDSCRGNVSHEG